MPNESVDNEHIEDFLGYIEGKKSRIKSIVLKRNGIKHRYYALNEEGAVTHRNSGTQLYTLLYQVLCNIRV